MNKAIKHEHGRYHPIDCRPPKPDDNWPYNNHPQEGNDRQYGIKSPKFSRHIFIRRDQVMYDIDAQIQMMAASRRKDDGTEDDRFTSATTTFQQMFYRWIDQAVGVAKGVMSAFVLEKFKDSKMNSISQNEEVDIELLMPEWYDDTVFEQLVMSIHEYVVNATLRQYFVLTLTSKDPVAVDKMQIESDALQKVRKYVNASKPGRIRKKLKPF